MKGSRLVTLLAFALLGCSLAAQDGERPNPNTSSAKSTFLVVYKPGPAWLPGKPLAGQPLKELARTTELRAASRLRVPSELVGRPALCELLRNSRPRRLRACPGLKQLPNRSVI